MKALQKPLLFAIIPFLMGISFEPEDPTQYRPVLMKKSDLPASVFFQSIRDFENPGKIYLYQDRIFIVDLFRGIHVINNQNPEEPHKTGFIHIPGIMDIAIQNNVLFADNAIDLVAIDLQNYPDLNVLDRKQAVFPEPAPPDLEYIPGKFSAHNRPPETVIVGWVKK